MFAICAVSKGAAYFLCQTNNQHVFFSVAHLAAHSFQRFHQRLWVAGSELHEYVGIGTHLYLKVKGKENFLTKETQKRPAVDFPPKIIDRAFFHLCSRRGSIFSRNPSGHRSDHRRAAAWARGRGVAHGFATLLPLTMVATTPLGGTQEYS